MPDYWKIDRKLIDRLCDISKLNLNENERNEFMNEIGDILNAFKVIDELDIKEVEPAYHPNKLENVWREDEVKSCDWNPLGNTIGTEKNYIKGPMLMIE